MILRRPQNLAALAVLALAALAAAACSNGAPVSAAECFLAQDGRIVGASGADCEPPPGATVEPTPTFTPIPTDSGGATGGAGLLIANGCATCHTVNSVPQARATAGPDLTGIGAKGADFIRESIINPGAVITEGYEDGLMPADFAETIPEADLDTLVEFLASQ